MYNCFESSQQPNSIKVTIRNLVHSPRILKIENLNNNMIGVCSQPPTRSFKLSLDNTSLIVFFAPEIIYE